MSNATELTLGEQGTQLFEFDAQSVSKRALWPQLLLKKVLCLVEGLFISLRVVNQFPKHALHS